MVTAALNRPLAAHAPSASTLAASVATTPTTSVDEIAASKKLATVAATTTTIPLIDPGPVSPPRAGAYPVRVTTNGVPSEGTLTIAADGTQRVDFGTNRVARLRWTPTGGQLLRTGEAKGDNSCWWNPTPMFIPSVLKEGRTWSSDVTCVTSLGSDTLTIRRQETAKVTRRVRTQIGTERLDAWLIERRIVTTSRGMTTSVMEEATTELFAPRIGLNVYTLRRIDVPGARGGLDSITESVELAASTPH